MRYSIVDSIVDNQGNEYNDIVFLDTDIFKGIKTRDWGRQLYSFVYNNLIGQQITVFDNMSESVIEFARKNDRVQKTGANNSRKVIDKLARKRDINSQLAVAHSVEVVSVSKYLPNQNSENTHQWLDENGWSFRTVYLMKRDGTILSALLNIAHAKDGRNILYDINKITVIGHGAVPSNSKKSRGSHINTNNGKKTITQSSEKSNPSDGKKSKDDTIDADYLSAVERGDTETAQQFSEVMDNARAEPEESGQKNNTHGVRYGKYIVPVKLEVKEFKDKKNGLHVAIALEKVKATEVSGQGNTREGVTQSSRSVANTSLAQLFGKINPNDGDFIKYIPDGFLNESQLKAKEFALMEDAKKGFDFVLLAEAYAKSGAVRSADKSNPTISIQSFLENVNDIEEFVKRIPVDKILDNSERSNTTDGRKAKNIYVLLN